MKQIVDMNVSVELDGKEVFQLYFKVKEDVSGGKVLFDTAELEDVIVHNEDEDPDFAREIKTFFFRLPGEVTEALAEKLYNRAYWQEVDGGEVVGGVCGLQRAGRDAG